MSSKDNYNKFKKKYKMPKLEDLEDTFAFKLSKDSENELYDICKAILESIDYAREVLEPILFLSESSKPSNFYEAGLVKVKECFRIYRKITELRWKYIKIYFDPKEENLADFINKSYKIWNKEIKKYLIDFSNKMENGWKNYKEKKNRNYQNYLG